MKRNILLYGLFFLFYSTVGILSARDCFDMVHHNPGEPLYKSRYNDPDTLRSMGYDGKVFFLFDSPTLAVDWKTVDSAILPDNSPEQRWTSQKADRIRTQLQDCKRAGLRTFAMTDLILFPKNLIQKYNLEKTFGDPTHPETQKFLRLLIQMTFQQFPDLDGLMVRVGETYLHDAPYHQGKINRKSDPVNTLIPLISLLRDEICVKAGKKLYFRTWMSFDTNLKTYQSVSDAIEPHPNLTFCVKHCEGDFHRGNPFSKIIGTGRHPQLIEVQCAREYEGKGAFPNYLSHGVIEGFEEHRQSENPSKILSLRSFAEQSPLFAGIWTWTRGGGWNGPYITQELWPDLNAWVLTQWVADPSQKEENIFNRYAIEKLKLSKKDAALFRELALLSAHAVIRGHRDMACKVSPWWTRDEYIGIPNISRCDTPTLLQEKDESVADWERIVILADQIRWTDNVTGHFAKVSCRYGLLLHQIYRAIFNLTALGENDNPVAQRHWINVYQTTWKEFENLSKDPACSTLYNRTKLRHVSGSSADEMVKRRAKKFP